MIRSEMNTIEGQKEWYKKIIENQLKCYHHVMKMKEEHMYLDSEKNARCGHTRGKKKRAAKSKVERRVYERYDIGELKATQQTG